MVTVGVAEGSNTQVVTGMEHALDVAQVCLAANTVYFPNTDYPDRAKKLRLEPVDYLLTGLLLRRLNVIKTSNRCCTTLLGPQPLI